ncbi:MAG: small subunit ribosomal protein [Patescibacteria group bacterium]|nr:small subunit ribosomal protein [Patescibacteria group bacterium]
MSKKEIETTIDEEIESIKRVYEMSYILVPTISESDAEAKAEALKKSIASNQGSFISEETPYVRDLAYEMLKVIKNANHRFETGYFGWVKFEMDVESVSNFEKSLKLDEEVIRFLIVKADRDTNIITKNSYQKKARESEEANIDTAAEAEASSVVEEVAATAEVEESKDSSKEA